MNRIIQLIQQYWLLLTLCILTSIATLSLWPAAYLPQVPGSDKIHHLISYGVLIFPLALSKPKYWLWIALSFAVFSGVIELIQPYVNRYAEWLDLAANVGGLICGIVVANIVLYFSSRYTK